MREIRTFEMGYDEPATAWRVDRSLVVEVAQGTLWLTVEGDAEDYWLEAGQSFLLPAGSRAWVGSGRGDVRLIVVGAGSRGDLGKQAALRHPRLPVLAPRWRQAAA
jgi:quercetin dioxygenase-like cupin family protein